MKDIDQLLTQHIVNPTRPLRADFTNSILNTLKAKKPSLTSRLKTNFRKRLKTKAGLFSIASGIVLLGGTAAAATYAVYRWTAPTVNITHVQQYNDDNRKQYTIDSQCGNFDSGKALQYEVARGASLSDDDAYKVFKNTCEYDAVSSFIDAHWVSDNDSTSVSHKKPGDVITIYNHDNIFAGSTISNPVFGLTTGRITAINATSITVSLPLYEIDNSAHSSTNPFEYYPSGKVVSRTIALAPNVEVWADGIQQAQADAHIGDLV